MISIAIIFGASIPYFSTDVVYAFMAISLIVFALTILRFRRSDSRDWVFTIALILPLLLALVFKITNQSMFGLWLIGLMALAPFGLTTFWKEVRQEALLRWFLVIFSIFISLGILSSITGRSHFSASNYQLISDLKPLILIILGYGLRWDLRMEKILDFILHWFWLFAIIFVLFEWLAPSMYFTLFPGGPGRMSTDTTSGLFPSRALGPFEHPSFLATTAAIFAILAASRALILPTKQRYNWFLTAIYFVLIIFSVQRQELASSILAIFLIYLLADTKQLAMRLMLLIPICIISSFIFWSVFSQNLIQEATMWGIGTLGPIAHPRAQLFAGAWFVAHQYFPIGAGLGTYGGAGAEKFDHSLYQYLGFANYWWYGKENYLMDTYWPNSIAETGFLGAIALLSSYLLLIIYAIKRCVKEHMTARLYWAAAAASTTYILTISFSSPAFQDARLFILPALLFGIASSASINPPKERV
jgi:hypothetical protein